MHNKPFSFFAGAMATPGNKPKLLGSQDLLTYYNLLPIYDKYVKPYPPPDRSAHLDQTLQPYVADLPGKPALNIPVWRL